MSKPLATYVVRITVHPQLRVENTTDDLPVPYIPTIEVVNDMVKEAFELATQCPVGVKSERADK